MLDEAGWNHQHNWWFIDTVPSTICASVAWIGTPSSYSLSKSIRSYQQMLTHTYPSLLAPLSRQTTRTEKHRPSVTFIQRKHTRIWVNIEECKQYVVDHFATTSVSIMQVEDVSIEEQLRSFSSTDILVGIHGAGLSMMWMMASGSASIIELDYINFYGFHAGFAEQLNISYHKYTEYSEANLNINWKAYEASRNNGRQLSESERTQIPKDSFYYKYVDVAIEFTAWKQVWNRTYSTYLQRNP